MGPFTPRLVTISAAKYLARNADGSQMDLADEILQLRSQIRQLHAEMALLKQQINK